MGLFHASAGLVYLDQTMMAVKKRFVRLHESDTASCLGSVRCTLWSKTVRMPWSPMRLIF